MRVAVRILVSIAISSVLLLLALPPINLMPLAWIALVPILTAVKGRGFLTGFGSLMVMSLLTAALGSSGVLFTGRAYGGHVAWHYLALSLFGIVAGCVGGLISEKRQTNPFVIAAWAVLIEALFVFILPLNYALSVSSSAVMLWLAQFGGIWVASYLVWLSNLWIASHEWNVHRQQGQRSIIVGLMIVGCSIPYQPKPQQGETLKVALMQTVSDRSEDYEQLNAEAFQRGAELVIWPELSGNHYTAAGDSSPLQALAKRAGQAPFITSFTDDAKPMPHNAAALFSKEGESAHYLKRRPFAGEVAMHRAGKDPQAVPFKGHQIGLNICFDSCYPSIIRDTARLEGVDLIAIPSMGPETPYAWLQSLHGAYAAFRSAEEGIPIVRSDVTGYSGATDARGGVIAVAGPTLQGIVMVDVLPERRWTLYRLLGNWFLYACGFIALGGMVQAYREVHKRLAPKPLSIDFERDKPA